MSQTCLHDGRMCDEGPNGGGGTTDGSLGNQEKGLPVLPGMEVEWGRLLKVKIMEPS